MVAVAVWQKEIKSFIDNREYADVVYSFTVNKIETDREKYLAADSALNETKTGDSLGKIISSQSENATIEVTLVDGTVDTAQLRDKKNVRCTAAMRAVKKENGFFTESGTMIVPGKTLTVETAKAVFEIRIESVSDRASDIN